MSFSRLVDSAAERAATAAKEREAALVASLKPAPVVACIDFETEAIVEGSPTPPRPVGVAIRAPGQNSKYLAWGHPDGNNITEYQARSEITGLWRRHPILTHTRFDIEVASYWWDLPWPQRGWHNTEFLAFLENPHASKLKLKDLAAERLGMPPDEQRDLYDWIKAYVPEARGLSVGKLGAFISKAPVRLVAPYARGDVDRTLALYRFLYPRVAALGMLKAYERELRQAIVVRAMEHTGMGVDVERLAPDLAIWERDLEVTDDWFRKRLKTPDLEVDKNDQLADALERGGFIRNWILTKTGKRSTAIDALHETIENPMILDALEYRSKLATCIRMFGRNWIAGTHKGRFHTRWNQVRGDDGGARTGRFSSAPNLQNIMKEPMPLVPWGKHDHEKLGLEPSLLQQIHPLPTLRSYVVAAPGWVFLDRDYKQQEVRILAHYEDGDLLEAFKNDPNFDLHTFAQRTIQELHGLTLSRKIVKNIMFAYLYGAGIGKLAKMIGSDYESTSKIRGAYLKALPGLRRLSNELKERAKDGEPIRTWGGRLYHVEPPKMMDDGTYRTFDYKLLNVLIQGSAADCTKEAMIAYYEHPKRQGRMILTVHDELLVEVPERSMKTEMARFREAMSSVKFDLPMDSSGTVGKTWTTCVEMEGVP